MDHFRLILSKLPPSDDITKWVLIFDVVKTFDVLGWFSLCTMKIKIVLSSSGRWRTGMILYHKQFEIHGYVGGQNLISCLQTHPSVLLWQGNSCLITGVTWLHWCICACIHSGGVLEHGLLWWWGTGGIDYIQNKGGSHQEDDHFKVRALWSSPDITTAPPSQGSLQSLASPVMRLNRQHHCSQLAEKRSQAFQNMCIVNRVSNLTELIDPDHWWHVSGAENPADCASRGLFPSNFLTTTCGGMTLTGWSLHYRIGPVEI